MYTHRTKLLPAEHGRDLRVGTNANKPLSPPPPTNNTRRGWSITCKYLVLERRLRPTTTCPSPALTPASPMRDGEHATGPCSKPKMHTVNYYCSRELAQISFCVLYTYIYPT